MFNEYQDEVRRGERERMRQVRRGNIEEFKKYLKERRVREGRKMGSRVECMGSGWM